MTDTEQDQETQNQPFFKRVARMLARVGLTLAIATAAVFAVQLGNAELAQRAQAAAPTEAAPLLPVQTAPIVLEESYLVRRSLVGQVEPKRSVAISFELSGQLADIFVDEGDQVRDGEKLAKLDTRLLEADQTRLAAQKKALNAQLRFAEQTLQRQAELSNRGFASQSALDEATSRSDELRARISEVEAAQVTNAIQIEKSIVEAPFSGRVTEHRVDGGESLAPGQAILEIVEDSAPQVRVGVPLDLDADDLREAQIVVGGKTYDAALASLRPDVDAVTRTRTALFALQTDRPLTFGQTARLLLSERVEKPGIWVALTSLQEGVRGQWTILAVDSGEKVRAVSVQVQHIDGDRAYVSGAFPPGTQLIEEGPQRVTIGQRVAPQTGLTVSNAAN
ncbi:MAG: efflux RND transporter periplasmic adaptor subunit [Pseudomonadota bacterium]